MKLKLSFFLIRGALIPTVPLKLCQNTSLLYYKITIESINENKVISIVKLINFQMPDVPINKCLGLQILADAYRYLIEFHSDTNLPEQKANSLANRAHQQIINYSNKLKERHDSGLIDELRIASEKEIEEITELDSGNFDLFDDWQNKINNGMEVPEFKELNVYQKIEFKVTDINLLNHLVPGFNWNTAMYIRDETY